ncbi:hypothetical protein [Pseudomonas sp. REB1044]|uniref:DUF7716 domain-containing protein n=1 Tax=Pseudomonas sp. REB1044 TaxID=2675224 RepID=UPI00315CD163
MLQLNAFHGLADIIEAVKVEGEQGDYFCLYGEDQDDLDLAARYFIAGYPDVEHDREVYPPAVQHEGLSYLYSGQQFADVVWSLQQSRPDARHEDYVRALNYYQDHDTFIEL